MLIKTINIVYLLLLQGQIIYGYPLLMIVEVVLLGTILLMEQQAVIQIMDYLEVCLM